MKLLYNIEAARAEVLSILKNPYQSHEQTVHKLAKTAENILPYPAGTPDELVQMYDELLVCDLGEGHAPYAARYILPDYELFMKKGSQYLDLTPPTDLIEALNDLLIFYRSTPSVTHMPVYMGEIDTLLEPFIDTVDEVLAKKLIKNFLLNVDRTFGSSFCHMNLSGKDTKSGRIILACEAELRNAVPNMTLLYDPKVTPDDYAQLAISTSMVSANPAFAYAPKYYEDFKNQKFGIVSCYNGLPVGGGAYTLTRIRLNRIAEKAVSKQDFLDNQLPKVVDAVCHFMEAKIRFLVEETPFFTDHFLVKEGFIRKDNFIGLFGFVGLADCVNHLMKLEGKEGRFGPCEQANQLGVEVMDHLQAEVRKFTSAYSGDWDHKFMLHAQVGAENDENTTPGCRIPIGEEIELYAHLKQAGLYHKYCPTGIGDIFPFDSTGATNPAAVLDIFKGAFKVGMRYISTYENNAELVRVTGYLVKKSEIERYKNGNAVINDTNIGSYNNGEYGATERRKVRSF